MEEDRRVGVLGGLCGREVEVPLVPARLARDRLDEEGVDLGQRVITRERAERVRQVRVAARVVERVACLVEKALVVRQPALRPGDEVDDRRRIGWDDTRTRRLLRAVLEVGADVLVAREIEAELGQRREANFCRPLLRVDVAKRRQPAYVCGVVRGWPRRALGAKDAVEPPLAHLHEGVLDERATVGEHLGELPERDALVVLGALDGIGDAAQLRPHLLRLPRDAETPLVHRRGRIGVDLAQLLALVVRVEDGELRLGVTQRHLLAAVLDTDRQELVLNLILEMDELACEQAALARLPQPMKTLTLDGVALVVLPLTQVVELLCA